ncbi:MAG TPA: hypothetical protein VLY03_01435 [Bacteroidota bacterium]|nr:hypothetical protein [Bacteroidota bacterium]
MKESSHSVFVIFLLFIGTLAVVSLSVRGWNYYLTPVDERPFRPDYSDMRPSGNFSHALGIFGSLMIIVGVATYSTRKRVRSLSNLGRLSGWLNFHIFLCLLGPILVVFHTTFKQGGIAAISLWTMLSVVGSGVVGRFLYVQIPRNRMGAELSADEINREIDRLAGILNANPIGVSLVRMIDGSMQSVEAPRSLFEMTRTLLVLERMKGTVRRRIHAMVKQSDLSRTVAHDLSNAAMSRASLLQKSVALTQVERVFYYWHIIHFPFSIIMFVTLAAHVAVTLALGYTWIF